MIKGLHHNAYRCRDSEETRQFYQEFLELPLANAFEIATTQTGRSAKLLHSFYEMGDGSFLAFFESPGQPFDFKEQHDFDLHIALEVDDATLTRMFEKGGRKVSIPAASPTTDFAGQSISGIQRLCHRTRGTCRNRRQTDIETEQRQARAALDAWQTDKSSL